MKRYVPLLIVLSFCLFTINVNLAHAYDAGCTAAGPYSATTGKLCNTDQEYGCTSAGPYNIVTGKLCSASNVSTNVSSDTSPQTLSLGSRGDQVKVFQQMLEDAGFSPGKVDGIYGPLTYKAATEYYKKYPPVATPCADGEETIGETDSFPPRYICRPITNGLVVSGISGPQTLNLNQTGTWTVTAYDKGGGTLYYSVVWGDEVSAYPTANSSGISQPQQIATFSHSYTNAGTYTPIFTVTNQSGQSAKASLGVKVGNSDQFGNFQINPSSVSVEVGGTSTLQAMLNTCPAGVVCFAGPIPVNAEWTSSDPAVATVSKDTPCNSTICPSSQSLSALVTGISQGTTTITATYENSSGSVFSATALVTVINNNKNQAPIISSLYPVSGIVGSQVTIQGSGFTPTGNKIKFGDTGSENDPNYSINSTDGKTLSFVVPSSNYFSCWASSPPCNIAVHITQPGIYPVSVINTNGTSKAVNFTVIVNSTYLDSIN